MASTMTYADDNSLSKTIDQMISTNQTIEKNRDSLIRQSTKKADIADEVDTQALKLGGIHRREDARQYLELKSEAEEHSNESSTEKTSNKKEITSVVTQK
jgi:hypothetical protein